MWYSETFLSGIMNSYAKGGAFTDNNAHKKYVGFIDLKFFYRI